MRHCCAALGAGAGGALALPRPSMKRPLQVLVAPLPPNRTDFGEKSAGVVVFVNDPERQPELPAEALADCRRLIEAWQATPRGGRIPDRSAFRPEMIPSLLPRLAVLEWRGPETLIIRLAGEEIQDRRPHFQAGRNRLDNVTPAYARQLAHAFAVGFSHPGALSHVIEAPLDDNVVLTIHGLAVPFLSSDGDARFIVISSHEIKRSYSLDALQSGIDDLIAARWIDLGYGVPDGPTEYRRDRLRLP